MYRSYLCHIKDLRRRFNISQVEFPDHMEFKLLLINNKKVNVALIDG